MKIIFIFSLLFISIAYSLGAASIAYYKDPKYPGKCVINGLILSAGEERNDPEKCQTIQCMKNSQAGMYSCGVFKAPDGCKLGNRLKPSAFYPDCCEREIVCNTL